MSLSSRLRGHLARITETYRTNKESQYLPDQEDDEGEASMIMYQKWQRLKRLPISAETVFLEQIREDPKRFVRKTKGSISIEDAWNGLSFRERESFAAKAKKNETYNTANFAKLNALCPLSPTVKVIGLADDVQIPVERPSVLRCSFGIDIVPITQRLVGAARHLCQNGHSESWTFPSNCGGKSSRSF